MLAFHVPVGYTDKRISNHCDNCLFKHDCRATWKDLPGRQTEWTNSRPLNLELGLHYHFRVAGLNNAGLTSIHHTDGVIIDTTPPEVNNSCSKIRFLTYNVIDQNCIT